MSAIAINELIGYDSAIGYFDRASGYGLTIDEAAAYSAENGLTFAAQGVSSADNRDALNQAAAQAAETVGITGKPKGDWTQREAVDYIAQFKSIILAKPDRFDDLTYRMAQAINTNRPSYGNDAGRKLIDPNAFVLGLTDVIGFAADSVQSTYGESAESVRSVGEGFIDALGGLGKSISVLGSLAPLVISAAAIGFLWFAVQSAGADPGGQFSKVVRSFR